MRDYIAEANKFMYDDNYIVETKVSVNGKKYVSKKAAEEDLKKKGLSNADIEKHLKNAKEIHDVMSSDYKDEHWAHEKHNYSASFHKKAIDDAEVVHKKGKLTKKHIDSLKLHTERGQKAYDSATKVWDDDDDD